jgi:hypothetical protein
MRINLAGVLDAAVEVLGNAPGPIRISGQQDQRGVIPLLGAEMDLRHVA